MDDNIIDIERIKAQERGLIYVRDALSFYLNEVRRKYDFYNIIIIFLSMATAFFETLKTELSWDTKSNTHQKVSALIPIAMNTCIALISTYTKFLRFTESIEDTTKSIEKCHTSIDKQRKVILHIKPIHNILDVSGAIIKTEEHNKMLLLYSDSCNTFREAILSAETIWLSRMDPVIKQKYLQKSYIIHQVFDARYPHVDMIDSILKQSFRPEFLPSYLPTFRRNKSDNICNIELFDSCRSSDNPKHVSINVPSNKKIAKQFNDFTSNNNFQEEKDSIMSPGSPSQI